MNRASNTSWAAGLVEVVDLVFGLAEVFGHVFGLCLGTGQFHQAGLGVADDEGPLFLDDLYPAATVGCGQLAHQFDPGRQRRFARLVGVAHQFPGIGSGLGVHRQHQGAQVGHRLLHPVGHQQLEQGP